MTIRAAIDSIPFALHYFGDDWTNPAVEDIFVNGPDEYFARIGGRTVRREAPGLDALAVQAIVTLAGHALGQYADEDRPLIDCTMPTGERLNAVLHPCTPPNAPALSLRRASVEIPTIEGLGKGGLWEKIIQSKIDKTSKVGFVKNREYAKSLIDADRQTEFLKYCVQQRWTVAWVGETGSGKTFNGKAMINEVSHTPDERILFISDAEEFGGMSHPNRVHMVYKKGGKINGEMLIEAALRMGPRWIVVPEIRDGMAFALLRALFVSPGITSWHARSAERAFDSVVAMIAQHPAGAIIPEETVRNMFRTFIDVVIHVERDPATKEFQATDIRFGEECK